MENQENTGKQTKTENHSELKMDIKVSWKKENTSKSLNEEGKLVVDHENIGSGEFNIALNGENTKTFLSIAVDVLADKLKETFGSKTEHAEGQ